MATESGTASVAFGLTSAATWGIADFSGGLATRRTPVLTVVLLSQTTGLIVLTLVALASAERAPTVPDILWGAAAGVIGQIGLFALYRAMAIGQMGIAAPLTGVLAASVPVIFGAFAQGLPDVPHLAGFALALGGVWFVSRSHGAAGRPAGLGLAILAGLGFGSFLILIAQVRDDSVFWPLVAARVASISVMIGIALIRRPFTWPTKKATPLILLAGSMDVGGNAFFVLAEQAGRLDIAGVLSSLYPAMTVLLALFVLRERLARWQSIGVLMVLLAIPLIAAK
jgi:drug/metabolite transporter (DMT)-like permease